MIAAKLQFAGLLAYSQAAFAASGHAVDFSTSAPSAIMSRLTEEFDMPPMTKMFAAICLISAPSAAQADAQSQPKVHEALKDIDDWRKSIVMISIYCPGQQTPQLGSGVLISPRGHILTAGHVGGSCTSVATAKVGAIKSPYAAPGEEMTATLLFRRVNAQDICPAAMHRAA